MAKTTTAFTATIPMPFHGESVVEGVLVSWLVKPGDRVKRGQPLAEIETEKSVWTFESPCDGEVSSLAAKENDTVAVTAPLLEVLTTDENVRHLIAGATPDPSPEAPAAPPKAKRQPVSPERRSGFPSTGKLTPRVKGMLRGGIVDAAELEELRRRQGLAYLTGKKVEAHLRPGRAATVTTCRIAGLGVCVPERVVPNSAFREAFPDVSEAYIEQVTGIAERRYIAAGESTSDLAVRAARAALERARLAASDLDMIVLATTTPDMPLPATACAVQQKLGVGGIPAFDLAAACSGWLYGLSIARQFIINGTYRHVLVVAAEAMSRFTDPADRATAFLFGDGAGAVVLSSRPAGPVLGEVLLSSDPDGYDIIDRKAGGYWRMDGKRMYQGAVRMFSDAIQRVLERERLTVEDLRWVVPHQANERMWKAVAQRVGAPAELFFSNIRAYGNTSAATIPLALNDLVTADKLHPDDRIVLCAVGAGLTSASCLVTWG